MELIPVLIDDSSLNNLLFLVMLGAVRKPHLPGLEDGAVNNAV